MESYFYCLMGIGDFPLSEIGVEFGLLFFSLGFFSCFGFLREEEGEYGGEEFFLGLGGIIVVRLKQSLCQ